MKRASPVESTSTEPAASAVKSAATAMKTTATTAAAALRLRSLRPTEHHTHKDCGKNYGKDLLHLSPSNPPTGTAGTGANFPSDPFLLGSPTSALSYTCNALPALYRSFRLATFGSEPTALKVESTYVLLTT
jgi:hypothetical protein